MTKKKLKLSGSRTSTPTHTSYKPVKNLLDQLGPLTMGDTLEAIRDDLELNKVQMAERLGISKSQYGNITNGGAPVSVKLAKEFATILKHPEPLFITVALEDLLRRNGLKYAVKISKSA